MSFGYVGNGTQTLSVRGRTFLGLAVGQAILAIVTAGSVLASSHVGTPQPGGGTITFAGGDVTVKAPDGATSAISLNLLTLSQYRWVARTIPASPLLRCADSAGVPQFCR